MRDLTKETDRLFKEKLAKNGELGDNGNQKWRKCCGCTLPMRD